MSETMKLARFLAQAGVASRRASEKLIEAGRVTVNDEVVTKTATRVAPAQDRVSFDGCELGLSSHLYYLLHKPHGYTCSAADPNADRLAVDLLEVPEGKRVFNIGRLDRDSEGLILFTNDGDFANLVAHPRYGMRKTYIVHVEGKVTNSAISLFLNGIRDKGDLLKADEAAIVESGPGGGIVELVLSEGKKREVRRMCKAVGFTVNRLIRTQIGPLSMGEFKPGFWRMLTSEELAALRQAVS